ncbi:hypothetical protein ACP70R_036848 [Stipagrostis hirtigluma subsp. patula]
MRLVGKWSSCDASLKLSAHPVSSAVSWSGRSVACEMPRSAHRQHASHDGSGSDQDKNHVHAWLFRQSLVGSGGVKIKAMSSSDQSPASTPASGTAEPPPPPGRPTAVSSQVLDMGAQMVQALKPVRNMKQHACSFALYSHDLRRQLEVHHFVSRLNQDVLQCAVYDSDEPSARLIGVEYIVSDAIFEGLPAEEQRLWHSHAYEVKAGLATDVGVPEQLQRLEMAGLAKTYGKMWLTWQVDRGDALPLGAPALMVSPQAAEPGRARDELVRARDEKYGVDSSAGGLKAARVEMEEPEWINPNADYWRLHGKGFAVDVVPAEMRRHAPFP